MPLVSKCMNPRAVGAAACVMAALTIASLNAETVPTGSTTVSRVYVSYTPSGAAANKIVGYAVGANGALTKISGSPFTANVSFMAVNGSYLFGSNVSGMWVASFRMKANGALKWVNSTNVQSPDSDPEGLCTYPEPLILDHSGSTLYRPVSTGGLCESSHWQSFSVNWTTGKLHFIGKSADMFLFNDPISFIGNNKFAYASDCVYYRTGILDTAAGYVREAGGLLNQVGVSIPAPATKDPNDFYCRGTVAADPANHLAMAYTDTNNYDDSQKPTQIGVLTADSSGNLSTTSTWSNMLPTAVSFVRNLQMSRDGKVLAVAGLGGLQLFHFKGANPVTHFTGLLTTDTIDELYWDHNQHLFALSKSAGKLYVYTVTSTGVMAAPGSPHAITNPSNLIVQPLTDADGDWDHDSARP